MVNSDDRLRIPLRSNSTGQGLLLVGLALLAFGVVMVYSASVNVRAAGQDALAGRTEYRHFAYASLAALILGLLWRADYHWLERGKRLPMGAAVLLGISLLLAVLVLVPGIGVKMHGARRWLRFGPESLSLSLQPSELVKLTLLLFLACWLGRPKCNRRSFVRTFLPAVALVGLCVGLVITQDFGTAAVIGVSATAVLLLAGVPWYYLIALLPLAAAAFYGAVILNPNRMGRINAFLDPTNSAVGATYHVQQALIAVGSGGMWGKGLGNGSQKLGFVPEDSNDYIFTVICEELGFVGAAALLGLVAVFLYNAWRASSKASDRSGELIAGGLGILITLQALAHIAVNIGSAPPKGIGLPLVSAGGTSLVLVAAAVAMIVSVTAHPGGREPAFPVGEAARDSGGRPRAPDREPPPRESIRATPERGLQA